MRRIAESEVSLMEFIYWRAWQRQNSQSQQALQKQ